MNHFQELKRIAAAKRDKAIRQARREYDETIQRIAELEGVLRNKPQRRRRNARKETLTDLIYRLLPDDKPVSVNDVCGLIRSEDPDRTFTVPTIRTILNRMKQEGQIKQVADAGGTRRALFALPDAKYNPAKTMTAWAREVIEANGGPMQAVEIMVAMTEAGYEMQAPPAESVKHLERELRKSARFDRANDLWYCTEPI